MANSKTSPTAGETKSTDGAPSGDVTPVIAVNGEAPNTEAPASAEVSKTADDVPAMADLTGIRYTGYADARRLTKADLESLGVENPKGDLEWNAENGHIVPTEAFNAGTRDALLALPDFVVA